MPVFGLFTATATATATKPEKKPVFEHIVSHNDSMAVVESSPRSVASAVQPVASPVIPLLESPSTHAQTAKPSTNIHRFSLRALALASAFAHSEPKHKSTLSNQQEKKAYAAAAFSKRIIVQSLMPSSERRAKQSALVVRSLIIGPSVSPASPKLTMAIAMPQLGKVKSQLMQPKLANKLIVHLRALPSSGVEGENGKQAAAGPIHAVCLKHTDAEEHALYFSRLKSDTTFVPDMKSLDFAAIANTSIETLSSMFNNMQLVSLISSPDLGLGQPGDGPGILSGAVPTAETVIRGFEEITPQLFALGYATGRVILPNHQGVYPPTDRMSVLTYWWGLELVLPPPSLEYLDDAQSISGTIINFLTALAMINNGVREILPFVRYIAQFLDFEFNSIKRQNKGKGVVCAATWIMPAAMVPRPWDFPPAPAAAATGDTAPAPAPALAPAGQVTPVVEAPNPTSPESTPSRPYEEPFPPVLTHMPTTSPEAPDASATQDTNVAVDAV